MIPRKFGPRRKSPHRYGACFSLILLLSGCENPEEPFRWTSSKKDPTYPVERVLTDNTGQSLEATIIGRNADSITVVRKSDGARFVIPNTRLSAADQDFVNELPFHAAPRGPAPLPSASRPERGTLGFLRGRLQEIDNEIRANEMQLYQMNPRTIKARSLLSETNRLMDERAELAREIAELESK